MQFPLITGTIPNSPIIPTDFKIEKDEKDRIAIDVYEGHPHASGEDHHKLALAFLQDFPRYINTYRLPLRFDMCRRWFGAVNPGDAPESPDGKGFIINMHGLWHGLTIKTPDGFLFDDRLTVSNFLGEAGESRKDKKSRMGDFMLTPFRLSSVATEHSDPEFVGFASIAWVGSAFLGHDGRDYLKSIEIEGIQIIGDGAYEYLKATEGHFLLVQHELASVRKKHHRIVGDIELDVMYDFQSKLFTLEFDLIRGDSKLNRFCFDQGPMVKFSHENLKAGFQTLVLIVNAFNLSKRQRETFASRLLEVADLLKWHTFMQTRDSRLFSNITSAVSFLSDPGTRASVLGIDAQCD
jgi:hypothetical protein